MLISNYQNIFVYNLLYIYYGNNGIYISVIQIFEKKNKKDQVCVVGMINYHSDLKYFFPRRWKRKNKELYV